MTREEVLRGLERIRDVGVVNYRADMQVIDGAIEIIRDLYDIIVGPQVGKYESDSFLGACGNLSVIDESDAGEKRKIEK